MGRLRSWLGKRQPATLLLIRRYRATFGHWPNLVRPRSYSEKLLYKRLFDRRPLLRIWADKVAVRDHVRDRLGTDEHLIPLFGVYATPDEVAAAPLPDRFVLKGSHGSSWVKVFGRETPRDPAMLRALAADWLARDYHAQTGEWCYGGIPPRVIAETLLEEESGQPVNDYKLLCFNGEPRLVQATQDRFTDLKASMFDMDWRHLDLRQWRQPPVVDMPRAATLDTMVALARKLAAETDFLRVDLYQSGGRVYFGELTNYPFGGFVRFNRPEWDDVLGAWWRVPWRYR
jgi:hypothetical protein